MSEVLNAKNKLGSWTVACKLEAHFPTVSFFWGQEHNVCYQQ